MITCLIPPRYDFLCATIIDGLNQLDQEFYCDQLTNNVVKQNYVQFEKILPYCKKSNFILIFSNTDYQKRKQFVMENNFVNKTVYIDGSDYLRFEDLKGVYGWPIVFKREIPNVFEFKPYKAMVFRDVFKNCVKYTRDLIMHFLIKRKALPLPLAAERAYFRFNTEHVKKDINISCLLRPDSNQQRREINNLVENLRIPNTVVGPISNGGSAANSLDIMKDEYYKTLSRSKISISYPGAGFDTGRFWEILANKCLLFSPPIKIKMPHPFIEFKHFVPYRDLNELKKQLFYYIEHDQERERIACEGYRHLMRNHISKIRAEYLLDIAHEKLGNRM
jgi:hypothetical protein